MSPAAEPEDSGRWSRHELVRCTRGPAIDAGQAITIPSSMMFSWVRTAEGRASFRRTRSAEGPGSELSRGHLRAFPDNKCGVDALKGGRATPGSTPRARYRPGVRGTSLSLSQEAASPASAACGLIDRFHQQEILMTLLQASWASCPLGRSRPCGRSPLRTACSRSGQAWSHLCRRRFSA